MEATEAAATVAEALEITALERNTRDITELVTLNRTTQGETPRKPIDCQHG